MAALTLYVDSSFGYVILTLVVALLEVLVFGGIVGRNYYYYYCYIYI